MNSLLWRYYSQVYKRATGKLLVSTTASAGHTLFLMPVAVLIGIAFDHYIPAGDYVSLIGLGAGIIVLYGISSGLALWSTHLTADVVQTATLHTRQLLLTKLYDSSQQALAQMRYGRLHTLLVQDTERMSRMNLAFLSEIVPALITSAALCLILLWLNWLLFAVMLLGVIFVILISIPLAQRLRQRAARHQQAFAAFNEGILFALRVLDLTKQNATERDELARQNQTMESTRRTAGEQIWINKALFSLQDFVSFVIIVLLLLLGGLLVQTGPMSFGQLLTFYIVIRTLQMYFRRLSAAAPEIIEGTRALERVSTMLAQETSQPYRGEHQIALAGNIQLKNVAFSYSDTSFLKEITLSLQPGKMIGIMGKNGSGKSTIGQLILGFYRPDEGALYAENHAYDHLDIAVLRRQIGLLPQTPILFSGTVWENITYGREDATLTEVMEACDFADAHAFIEALPQGYQTPIGDEGVLLSGGQRQCIALARALLKRPALLILDEPTNHLDAVTMQRILANLLEKQQEIAILVMTHDSRLAEILDYIYVLDHGTVAASGSHTSLRDSSSHYRDIVYPAQETRV